MVVALKSVCSSSCSHQKLALLMNPKSREEEEEETTRMQTDVTDEEMALRYRRSRHRNAGRWLDLLIGFICFRYESLIGSIKKKFAKKRQRAAEAEDLNQNVEADSKRVFLKPQD